MSQKKTFSLDISIVGFKSDDGYANLKLISLDDGKVHSSARLSISELTASVQFEKIERGNYVVNLFHDENENNALDRGNMNMPVEGYGFSNNQINFQNFRPSDEENVFSVAEDTEIDIIVFNY